MLIAACSYKRFRRAVIVCQRLYKAVIMRRKFALFAKQLTRLQAHVRRRRAARRFRGIKRRRIRGAAVIQAVYRQHCVRRWFLSLKRSCLRLQHVWRVVLSNRRLRLWKWAASKMQVIVRDRMARMKEERLRRAALNGCVKIQVLFRAARAC